jgi:hypothetical protein
MIKENDEEIIKNECCYTFIYYQTHNKTRRDLQFLQLLTQIIKFYLHLGDVKASSPKIS